MSPRITLSKKPYLCRIGLHANRDLPDNAHACSGAMTLHPIPNSNYDVETSWTARNVICTRCGRTEFHIVAPPHGANPYSERVVQRTHG